MSSDDRTRIANAVAVDFNIVAEHGTELLDARLDLLGAVMNDDELLVGLDVGSDGACAHMRIVSEDTVTYIVIVRSLNVIKEDNVLKFNGIAYYAVCTDECGASDECAVADFSLGTDDARCTEICRWEDLGCLMYPDILLNFFIIISECGTQSKDKILDAFQCLPRICET